MITDNNNESASGSPSGSAAFTPTTWDSSSCDVENFNFCLLDFFHNPEKRLAGCRFAEATRLLS
jgi:hypothetical protein